MPNRLATALLGAFVTAFLATETEARTWSDSTGRYTVDADLVAIGDGAAVLQRGDHHLVSIRIEQLSEKDQEFLAAEETRLASEQKMGRQQTWTTRGGLEILGNIVDYVAKDVTVQRRRGKIYVNDRSFENLPEVYKKIVPKVVSHFEDKPIDDEASLRSWLVHRKGRPATYQCEGVVVELASGDEYAIPFFLLSDKDLEVLRPGWDAWVAAQDDHQSQTNLSGELRALAAARHQDQQVTQQVAKLQLAMQAVDAGVTSLWEVTLYPARGTQGSSLWVVVPGRDSRQATATALAKNPGYAVGPVRRVSR